MNTKNDCILLYFFLITKPAAPAFISLNLDRSLNLSNATLSYRRKRVEAVSAASTYISID